MINSICLCIVKYAFKLRAVLQATCLKNMLDASCNHEGMEEIDDRIPAASAHANARDPGIPAESVSASPPSPVPRHPQLSSCCTPSADLCSESELVPCVSPATSQPPSQIADSSEEAKTATTNFCNCVHVPGAINDRSTNQGEVQVDARASYTTPPGPYVRHVHVQFPSASCEPPPQLFTHPHSLAAAPSGAVQVTDGQPHPAPRLLESNEPAQPVASEPRLADASRDSRGPDHGPDDGVRSDRISGRHAQLGTADHGTVTDDVQVHVATEVLDSPLQKKWGVGKPGGHDEGEGLHREAGVPRGLEEGTRFRVQDGSSDLEIPTPRDSRAWRHIVQAERQKAQLVEIYLDAACTELKVFCSNAACSRALLLELKQDLTHRAKGSGSGKGHAYAPLKLEEQVRLMP